MDAQLRRRRAQPPGAGPGAPPEWGCRAVYSPPRRLRSQVRPGENGHGGAGREAVSDHRGSPVPHPAGCSRVLGADGRGCSPLLGGDSRECCPLLCRDVSRARRGCPAAAALAGPGRAPSALPVGPAALPGRVPIPRTPRDRQRSCASAPTFPVLSPPCSGLSREGCFALCKHS